jgi:hypothetical protein
MCLAPAAKPPGREADRVRRPSGGRRFTLHLSEANSKEAARPPVVLETVGRRSFGALSP